MSLYQYSNTKDHLGAAHTPHYWKVGDDYVHF